MSNIREKYEQEMRQYGEDRILWIAAAADNIDISENIIDESQISIYYLPTEDELYNIEIYDGLTDIRNIISLALKNDIKFINTLITSYKIINPKYNEYINNDFFTYLKLIAFDKDELVIKKVKNIIKNLILSNLNENSQEEELIKILTKTEIKVLQYIIRDFNYQSEGDIKVNQATEQYNISTSVFRTLFYKLKEYGVATIDSRGVKGTHVTFRDISILKSLFD